jgi:hypothetical protein
MVTQHLLHTGTERLLSVPRFPVRLQSPRVVIDDGLVKLGASLFRVFPFETRRSGEAMTCPPRTVGIAGMALGQGEGGQGGMGEREALQMCLSSVKEPTAEAAKEKVIFCNRLGRTLVYQADRQNQAAALCTCGNATAASAAMVAFYLNRSEVRQTLVMPDGELQMRSQVTPAGGGGWRVEQSWCGIDFKIIRAELCDKRVAIGTGTFNNYVFIEVPETERETFDLPEVLAMWNAAKPFGFDNPLRSRLVALFPNSPHPYAKFYSCGRMHPGAPLTGLAALSVAVRQVDWLACLLKEGRIAHRRGVDTLPMMTAAPTGTEIEFCPIHVTLESV